MRINEIFYSLQGEGRHTGVPAVFVRFSGCNLRCPFCDTDYHKFIEMSVDEVVAEASRYPARTVVLTGGEPLLQVTAELTAQFHRAGFAIHVETNGTQPLPDGVEVEWITCSPKEGSKVVIQRVDELKIVFWGQDVSRYENSSAELRLQPLDCGDEEHNKELVKQTVDYIKNHPIWKLSLQTHKILNIR